MQKCHFNNYQTADIGDYLKVFACTAVMSQPIMSMMMSINQPTHVQDIFGIFYNLVKYTAPAFIFGILYSFSSFFAFIVPFRTNSYAGCLPIFPSIDRSPDTSTTSG